MKKFLIACAALLLCILGANYLHYYMGVSFSTKEKVVTAHVKNEGKTIMLEQAGEFQPFEIKGVDMGVGIPNYFATDFAIPKETYLRWFRQIQEMGANTVRIYTILHDDFYNAVYEYNLNNSNPLYIIHGVWVNDYVQYSRMDAYAPEFQRTFMNDCKTVVDILHGKKKLSLGYGLGSGSYTKDISPWVLGYILGVEWEPVTVVYTDQMQKDKNSYQGAYMYTTPEASPFEAMLAQVGDSIIAYETERYGTQRLVAFSNWPTTDPFDYLEHVNEYFLKITKVDVEHIKTTESFVGGTFASYHIYPYYPDYLEFNGGTDAYLDASGKRNTYLAYLKMINDHHSIPVIISEFGLPTSRGMAQQDINTNRNQGGMSETEQGRGLVECYRDIKAAGCAGSVIFTWQDEWFKRTWNTMHAVDLLKTPYWSDYQTNEQYFGLLSFDPGKEKSICYVDGDVSEWTPEDLVAEKDGLSISTKYDEKFFYMLVHKKGLKERDKLYIPIDTTPKSGSSYSKNEDLYFTRSVDFLLALQGRTQSRLLVQERYNILHAMFSYEVERMDSFEFPPALDSPLFQPINLLLRVQIYNKMTLDGMNEADVGAKSEVYETGLLTHGNANPSAPDFNSLADFCYSGDYVEIKLPWQLLNFSNPSEMRIHDDYYEHYGVEELSIKELYLGIGMHNDTRAAIQMHPVPLKGWGINATSHERLKQSYYIMQKEWGGKPFSSTDGVPYIGFVQKSPSSSETADSHSTT